MKGSGKHRSGLSEAWPIVAIVALGLFLWGGWLGDAPTGTGAIGLVLRSTEIVAPGPDGQALEVKLITADPWEDANEGDYVSYAVTVPRGMRHEAFEPLFLRLVADDGTDWRHPTLTGLISKDNVSGRQRIRITWATKAEAPTAGHLHVDWEHLPRVFPQ